MESTPLTSPYFLLKLLILLFTLHQTQSTTSPPPPPPPLFPSESLPTQSGHLTVNLTTGSSIFYIFHEAQTPISPLSQTPLLIWLQGGPGCSSMTGNFFELGPWLVKSFKNNNNTEQLTVERNPGSWNRLFGLLFLDNPIGTGFSIASKPEEIPRDQEGVAKHLYTAIEGFLKLSPKFKDRPIYITGESYAGKYVPSIGYYILQRNAVNKASLKLNLKGVAIGNGLTDPITQVATHANNAYFSGLINQKQKLEIEKAQSVSIKLTETGNWSEAADARNRVLRMLSNMTGLSTLYDYSKRFPYKTSLVDKYLSNPDVKRRLGVNESMAFQRCSNVVKAALHGDVMKSVKFMVEYLVKNSRVLLYQGQFDLRESVVSTEAWMKTMKWEGISGFLKAERKVWKMKGLLAGYVQKWRNLSHTVVLGAGHLVPADQGLNAQAMIEDWVMGRGLYGEETVDLSSECFGQRGSNA